MQVLTQNFLVEIIKFDFLIRSFASRFLLHYAEDRILLRKFRKVKVLFSEDDFAEVSGSSSNEDFSELERSKVINICGCDKDGLPVIVVAACRFPNNNTKEHHQLLRFIKAKLGS